MNINSMKPIMSIAHKSQDAVHMIGPHGIGKTQIVKAFAEQEGFHVEVLQVTVMDTGDLLGMPVIEETRASATGIEDLNLDSLELGWGD